MTLARIKPIQFPRPADVEFLLRWRREGAVVFSGQPSRYYAVESTRLLIERMGMDPLFEQMRVSCLAVRHGGLSPRGSVPRSELLAELSRNLRVHGYVLADFSARVPLTGMQLYVLRSLAHGHGTTDIAADTGISQSSVRETVSRLKGEMGCTTMPQLVGCAYRNRWFPDHEEFLALSRMSSHPLSPGHWRLSK